MGKFVNIMDYGLELNTGRVGPDLAEADCARLADGLQSLLAAASPVLRGAVGGRLAGFQVSHSTAAAGWCHTLSCRELRWWCRGTGGRGSVGGTDWGSHAHPHTSPPPTYYWSEKLLLGHRIFPRVDLCKTEF